MHMSGRPDGNALKIVLALGTAALCAITALGLAGLRINTTNSLPLGIYVITSDPTAPLVEFCPEGDFSALSSSRGYRPPGPCPDGAAPLLKPVIANSGDTVAVVNEGIRVNGRLLPNTAPQRVDTAGRPLTAWPPGAYAVAPATLWVASTYHPDSFDSRYFGPIPVRLVRHRLRSLWVHGSVTIAP
jgi:conjugative transfer signal peptidase TraF